MEFREMRRFKQALTKEECAAILRGEKRGTLAVIGDGGWPYALPINFWYDEEANKIYFHCGKAGHKLDATRSNENTLIRKMVAHRLIDEGYGCSEIGRAMGKHHATVLHLNRCMVDMLSLPACYKPELCMYREFEARTAAQMAAKEEDT